MIPVKAELMKLVFMVLRFLISFYRVELIVGRDFVGFFQFIFSVLSYEFCQADKEMPIGP